MDFRDWEPYYLQILADFHYDQEMDVRSARLLDEIIGSSDICDESRLMEKMGHTVSVFGASPSLKTELAGRGWSGSIVSAGSATSILMADGIVPDVMFTDLDGDVAAELEANRQGAIAIILAHGDNIPLLQRYVPKFVGAIMPTCQCRPFGRLRNFGGFTDGDRAVMAARHFGAGRIELIGFDFTSPREKAGGDMAVKRKKLRWAQHIIYDLNPSGVDLVPSRPPSAGSDGK